MRHYIEKWRTASRAWGYRRRVSCTLFFPIAYSHFQNCLIFFSKTLHTIPNPARTKCLTWSPAKCNTAFKIP